jgi:hypothetical protein
MVKKIKLINKGFEQQHEKGQELFNKLLKRKSFRESTPIDRERKFGRALARRTKKLI